MNPEQYGILVEQATDKLRSGEYGEAISLLGDAVECFPFGFEAYQMRGVAFAIANDHERAIEDFSQALSTVNLLADNGDLKGQLLGLRACSYGRSNQFGPACEDLKQAIELQPNHGAHYAERGRIRLYQEDFSAANADLSRAIELDSSNGPAYCNRGMVRTRLNDNDGAFADFKRALECDPNDTSAMLNRGLMFLTQNNREAALRDFRQARAINPALAPNIDRIYRDFNLSDDAAVAQKGSTAPSGKTTASSLTDEVIYSRYFIGRGSVLQATAIRPEDLTEKGLNSVAGMLVGLRAGAASVVRAVLQTADTQQVQFGIPADVFENPVPQLNAFTAKHPEGFFTVTAGSGARSINLVIPQHAGDDYVSAALLMFIISIGNEVPDQARFNQVYPVARELWVSRPSVATVMMGDLKNDAALNDLIGFTEHFAAKLLTETLEPIFLDDDTTTTNVATTSGDPEIPFSKVTLEMLVEFNVRSCEILTGRAGGSRAQAQAYDDWLESYRGADSDLMEAMLRPGRKLEANLGIMGRVIWTEVAEGPIRFTSAYNTTSCYFIPRNAAPVPSIVDYQPRV